MQPARVERLGNILAGTLALSWCARGAMIASPRYRDVTTVFLEGFGDSGTAAARALPAISVLFLALGLAFVFRPADRRLHAVAIAFALGEMVAFSLANPTLVAAPFGGLTKGLVVVALALGLRHLATEAPVTGTIERLLRYGLGLTWVAHGVVALVATPPAEVDVAIALAPGSVDPRALAATAGAFDLLCGLAVLGVPTHGTVLRTIVWVEVGVACAAPAAVGFADASWLHHPLAPFLKNLPLLGAAAGFLYLARQGDVQFAGHLRRAARAERFAAVVYGLQAVRFGGAFERIALEEEGQIRGLTGLIGEPRDALARILRAIGNATAWVTGSILVLLPCSVNATLSAHLARHPARCYRAALACLPDKSLSRRVLEDLIRAKKRHAQWLAEAA